MAELGTVVTGMDGGDSVGNILINSASCPPFLSSASQWPPLTFENASYETLASHASLLMSSYKSVFNYSSKSSIDFWSCPGRGAELAQHFRFPIILACVFYFLFINWTQKFMKNRAPMPLKFVTFIWNAVLSILSFGGLYLALRDDSTRLLSKFFLEEWTYTPGTRFVVAVFCLTKIVEFGDTMILILKKRELKFLHVFHHFTVALYCWHSQWTNVSFAHCFVLMNLLVHGIMYAYYATVTVWKSKFLMVIRRYITIMQIMQMLLGIYISSQAMYDETVKSSNHPFWNAQCCLILYIVYAYLFCLLYVESYHKNYRAGMSVFLVMFHIFALVGVCRMVSHQNAWSLFGQAMVLYILGGFGITCGAHRLWAHRSYKAGLPFRIFLLMLNSIANQGSIYHWCRDHRVHHKYSEEDADPHNARYGFWYSHVGWLLMKKPVAVSIAGREMDMSDLADDGVVMFQKRLDPYWNQIFCFILPGIYTQYMYGSYWLGFFILGCMRWLICLHATWTVNSVAHIWGDRPYDPSINPAESLFTAFVAVGEGWHNWHHVYPFDYATSEGGIFSQWNPSKLLIDTAAYFGLVWNRKRATACWGATKARRNKMNAEKLMAASSAELITGPISTTGADSGDDSSPATKGLRRIPSFKGTLPAQLTKKSLFRSFLNLARDVAICGTIALCAVLIKQSPVGKFCSESFFINQLVNFLLWTIYALAQGTVAFGVWVLSYEAAGGRFSDYRVVNHVVGITVSTLLCIPYRPRRANKEGEKDKASLMKCLKDDAWAILKVPQWNSWQVGFVSALAACAFYSYVATHWGFYQMFKWVVGPWMILNCWLCLYHWLLENGPQDAGKGLDDYNECTLEYFTADWLQSMWPKATKGRRYPWTRLVDHLHHHLSLSHIIQAVDFNVPHYHAAEAFKRLGDYLEEFQNEIHEARKQLLNAGIQVAKSEWKAALNDSSRIVGRAN